MLKHGGNKHMVVTCKTSVFKEKQAELQVRLWATAIIVHITLNNHYYFVIKVWR